MYEKTYTLIILTPERTIFEGPVTSLVAPGKMGRFGVLAGHAPMICSLTHGDVRVKHPDGREEEIPVRGGFCLVEKDRVTLLADSPQADTPAGP